MDNEINRARLGIYQLIKSFFDTPPNNEKITIWYNVLFQLKTDTGFLKLDVAATELFNILQQVDPDQIAHEYYELFENPFSPNKVQLCASFYIDGRLFGQSLVKLRQLLYNLNLGRSKNFTEPEDNFLFLVDIMIHLMEERQSDEIFLAQQKIFQWFLLPCFKGIAKRINQLENFSFFKGISKFIEAYFILEESLFPKIKTPNPFN